MATIDNLIIDSVLSVTGFGLADGEIRFQMNQLQDATLNGTSESIDVNGMRGMRIATLDRSKGCSFECTNGLFVVNAFADQVGAKVQEASTGAKIKVPFVESVEVKDNVATLSHTPVEGTALVYKMSRSGGQGEKLKLGATAEAAGTCAVKGNQVTIHADETFDGANKSLIVSYYFEAQKGIKIVNDSEAFTEDVRLLVEIVCRDVCDSKIYITVLEMFRAKIDGNFSLSMGNEAATHPLTANTLPNLCSANKDLFAWYIVEDEGE